MTTDNFCFYLQNRLIQTGQTGGQLYSDTSPFRVPWENLSVNGAGFALVAQWKNHQLIILRSRV